MHVLTADTFGKVRSQLADYDFEVVVLPREAQDVAKERYVEDLGPSTVAAYGNGRNDRRMLSRAALGVVVVQKEGAASSTVVAADVVCPDILSGLDLLGEPLRLVATLRC